MTVANVRAGFGRLFTMPVDGAIYAQPLYVPNLDIPGKGRHNVVYVATENDSVYAFDADSDTVPLWQVRLVPGGEAPVKGNTRHGQPDLNSDVGWCPNIQPFIGITGTPVIDAATNTLYVVAKTKTTRGGPIFRQRLWAVDLATGGSRHFSPVEIQAADRGIQFEPRYANQRAGLLTHGGVIYVAFGAHCDVQPYYGWVLAYDAATLDLLHAFVTAPGSRGVFGAGVWQSGMGLAADAEGHVYFSTGNGPFTADAAGADYGNSILKLRSDLSLADYFTPFNQGPLNANDWDLGSGGVMLLPQQMGSTPADLLVGCGKQGVVYVLDRSQPGPGLGSYNGPNGRDRAVQTFDLYPGRVPSGPGRPTGDDHDMPGVFGGPAYFAGPAGQLVYYGGSSGPVKAFALHNSRLAPATIAGGAPNQTQDTFPGSTTTPTISSNGGVTGTAIMWAVLRVNPHRLYAFDATDLTQRLFVGDAGPWNNPDGNDFPTPTAIGGKVYVSASNFVAVFGPGKVGKEHKDGKDGKEKEIRKDRKDTRDNNGGKLRLHEAVAGRQPADHGAVTGLVAEHIHEAPGGAVGQAFITPAERPEVGGRHPHRARPGVRARLSRRARA